MAIPYRIYPLTIDNWPVGARFVDFLTGSAIPREEHKAWVKTYFAPKMKKHPNAWIDLLAFASRKGDPNLNMRLSQLRLKSIESLIKGHHPDIRVNVRIPYGEGAAKDDNIPDGNDDAYWRAVLVRWYGVDTPGPLPYGKTPEVQSDRFAIRVVGGGSASIFIQADYYYFQIVDLVRRKTAFFYYVGGGAGVSIPKIPGPGSATKSGPPAEFRTSRPAELHQFNSPASLFMDPGYTFGPMSPENSKIRLSIDKIADFNGLITTTPNVIPMSGGSGIQMPGLGSATTGVLAKVTDDWPFTGY